MKKRFFSILKKVSRAKILVVGDLMLDEYIWGDATRISPEAPVPVIKVNSRTYSPGGASNVAHNLKKLGVNVSLAGIIGDDGYGRLFKDILKEKEIDYKSVLIDGERPTTLKTRIMAQGYQIARADHESIEPIRRDLSTLLLRSIEDRIQDIDAVIISDYGKGVINSFFISQLVPMLKKHKKIVTVDPKEINFPLYQDVTAITPNRKEAEGGSKIKITNNETLINAGKRIMNDLNLRYLLITRSEEGMSLFDKNIVYHIPTVARTVYDVTGAGDTVISHFTAYLAIGANPLDAAILANLAAGIKVTKLGSAAVTKEEIEHYLEHEFDDIKPIKEKI